MSKTVGYPQIAAHFRQQIQDGTLRPGDALPSFKAAGAQFGVAHTTVNRAYRVLKQEGLTLSKTGVGTVVADPADPPGRTATGGSGPRREPLMTRQETRIRAIMLADEAEHLAAAGEYQGAMAYAAVAQAYAAIVSTWGGDEPKTPEQHEPPVALPEWCGECDGPGAGQRTVDVPVAPGEPKLVKWCPRCEPRAWTRPTP